MAEHHTQGRQGQGSRRRGNNGNRHHRQRVPRPEAAPERKPSFLERVLSFFGFKKKDGKPAKGDQKAKNKGKDKDKDRKPKENGNKPPQKVRVAKTNNNGGNPAAKGSRRRPNSTPPTDKARLYVGNLSYEATESELEDLFKGFGNVRSVEIIYNPRTYKSKGYAFVEMYQLDDARRATEVLHGQPFMGRELMVSAASEKPEGTANHEKPAEPAKPEAPKPEEPAEAPQPEAPEAPADEAPQA